MELGLGAPKLALLWFKSSVANLCGHLVELWYSCSNTDPYTNSMFQNNYHIR